MDRWRRIARSILLTPKRFLDWVYTDPGRTRPRPSEVVAHIDSFGTGIATSRALQEAADATGRHRAAVLDKEVEP